MTTTICCPEVDSDDLTHAASNWFFKPSQSYARLTVATTDRNRYLVFFNPTRCGAPPVRQMVP